MELPYDYDEWRREEEPSEERLQWLEDEECLQWQADEAWGRFDAPDGNVRW